MFAHLHLHTEYSLLDGACRIAEIPKAVGEAGQKSVAITDHGVMYGVAEFYKACKAEGIKPILGCEVYVAARGMNDKEHLLDSESSHLTLLAENETGYKNLIKIATKAFTRGFYRHPRTDFDELAKYSEGIIALSGCISGAIPKYILKGDMSKARETIIKLTEIFGRKNFFLEIMRHGLPEQERVNYALLSFAEELGLEPVATNDVHYLKKDDALLQRLLTAIQTGTRLDEKDALALQGEQYYLKTEAEMRKLFSDFPQAVDNAGLIAERCCVELDFGRLHLPVFDTPKPYTADGYLKKLCYDGYADKIKRGLLPDADEYRERIEYELSVISKMGFSDYYLIVNDFVAEAKRRKIPVGPGRGSGVSSLCACCIGITEVDPLRFSLLFERFLNPERVSMPDFDIDFCDERRGEIIAYVTEKYGRDRVSQIITFGTLACRQAVRDAGRAMGMPYAAVDKIARMLPRYNGVTIASAIKESAALAEKYKTEPETAKLLNLASGLEGRPRNSSTHATGVVIADRPLTDYIPLAVNESVTVTQFTMNTVADLGLLKIDFLGLRFLTVIYDTEREIRKAQPDFSVDLVSFDDKKTFQMLCAGGSLGLFQLESEGMRSLLVRLKPDCLDDIISVISLYRPGPALSIEKFLKNRFDKSSVDCILPELEPVLSPTNGCMIYQEQVMTICRVLAGFSYGRADLVRRAMAKKKPEAMEKEHEGFLQGCAERGVPAEKAERVFALMSEFAKYAFAKSHAVAYAVVAYRTAYLKCNYRLLYMCSLLNTVAGYGEKVSEYINDCARAGIGLLPPDINESGELFTPEGTNIRFGLAAVKNVGGLFARRLIAEREKGKFTSLEDFITRVSGFGNVRMLESLALCGALDCFGLYRSRMVGAMSTAVEAAAGFKSRVAEGQLGMFETESESFEIKLPQTPEINKADRLAFEKELTGLYFSGHPLDGFASYISSIKAKTVAETVTALNAGVDKIKVTIVAMIESVTAKTTKNGDAMAFVNVADNTGSIEIIVFPQTYRETLGLYVAGEVLVFEGDAELKESAGEQEDEPKLLLRKAYPPKPQTPLPALYIKITTENSHKLKEALELTGAAKGDSKVMLYFEAEKQLKAQKDRGCKISEPLLASLKELMGEKNIAVK